MSDVFNEVDDELRQEKIQQFWNDNKYFIFGCVIIAVLFTSGINFFQDWRRKADIQETTAFYTALNTSDVKNLIDYTKVAKNDYAALSRFAAVSLLRDKDRNKEANIMLEEIQKNRDIKKIYRDFALLLETQFAIDTSDNDNLLLLEKKLLLLTDARSTWKNSAKETLAIMAGKRKDFVKAIAIIGDLETTTNLSPQMKARIKQLKALYIAKSEEKALKKGTK